MTFSVTQKTLERLDWPELLERLQSFARTPRGGARLTPEVPDLFAETSAGVRERLARTAEARSVLEGAGPPPLGDGPDPGEALGRARRGGALDALELLGLARLLRSFGATRRFLGEQREAAPELADLADCLPQLPGLAAEIESCLDPSGEVRDSASPELASARREARELAARLQDRLGHILRDPELRESLSDNYFTVRGDRYVLPVRADARGRVPGIVHDASGSGGTLFVEPQALVELNNQHKGAELRIEREVARVLRELSESAAESAGEIESALDTLAELDLCFARAGFGISLDASAPEVGDGGNLRLLGLRHPSLDPREVVPNDLRLEGDLQVLVISGPNAGGKTVAMKAAALAVLFVRAGLQVPADPGSRVDLFDAVLADIGDEQSIGRSLSTFSAHMANLAEIVDRADGRCLAVLDEVGVGTDPSEGAALAQAILESLADAGAKVIATTHFGLLKEMAEADARFANASVDFDPDTLAPTYRLRPGVPGSSSATAVAARMGLRSDVLERARGFLQREDRVLDQLLEELASHRASLEREQREASRLRAETEAARQSYRDKLEKLQERRDQLYRSMRDDLDERFRDAHAQVAAVIRSLQRGEGKAPASAQDAARARSRLLDLAERQREAEREAGVTEGTSSASEPLDWSRARPGDRVRIEGGGAGVLAALPDKRGRAAVSVGSARLLVAAERVRADEAAASPSRDGQGRRARVSAPSAPAGGSERCDLRGQRVAEALDQLAEALDRASRAGRDRLLVVHGLGTGALRKAVREHLVASPYVSGVEPAGPDEGGDGASIALLR